MSKVEMEFDDHWHLREALKKAKRLIYEAEKRSRSYQIKDNLKEARILLVSALRRDYEIKNER